MHPWRKPGQSIPFESTLERDFITLMAFDPSVEDLEGQPTKIVHDGGAYTPDFLVTYRRSCTLDRPRHVVVEVKYRDDLRHNWAEYRPRLFAARQWARERGMQFRVVTDRSIRGPRLENLKRLIPFLVGAPEPLHDEPLLAALRERGPTEAALLIASLTADPNEQALFQTSLWRLLAMGAVNADLDSPVKSNTVISLGGERGVPEIEGGRTRPLPGP